MTVINNVLEQSGGAVGIVYTCPAGISHAVVHVYLTANGGGSFTGPCSAKLNSNTVGRTDAFLMAQNDSADTSLLGNASASLILAPGDFIALGTSGASSKGTLTVTGYEVP